MIVSIGYRPMSSNCPDDDLIDLLGIPTDSGYGFNIRDIEWHDKPRVHMESILIQMIQGLVPENSLAYIIIKYSSDEEIEWNVSFQADWYKVEFA